MKKNLYRCYSLFRYGGWDYIWAKILKKIWGNKGAKRAKRALYLKAEKMKPEKYADEIQKVYALKTGKRLNLKNPCTFNEKMQWLKLYDSTPIKTTLSDKYLVREWIKEKIGEEYLIPLIGVWDKFEDIDLDKLPNSFALKANHGSGWNVIVKDKTKVDWEEVRQKFNKWMQLNYTFEVTGFQLQYLNIAPKIIAEEYIENQNGNLYDYKIHCFNGKPEYIQLIGDRGLKGNSTKQAFYDTDWNLQPFTHSNFSPYEKEMERPVNLDRMIQIAKTLSNGFPYVRVDLYELDNGDIKFGEMTFTPRSGFFQWIPPETDNLWGDKIKLPL